MNSGWANTVQPWLTLGADVAAHKARGSAVLEPAAQAAGPHSLPPYPRPGDNIDTRYADARRLQSRPRTGLESQPRPFGAYLDLMNFPISAVMGTPTIATLTAQWAPI